MVLLYFDVYGATGLPRLRVKILSTHGHHNRNLSYTQLFAFIRKKIRIKVTETLTAQIMTRLFYVDRRFSTRAAIQKYYALNFTINTI